ncbi:hypothetical protein D3C84_1078150 [compost metagenome]
MNGFVIIGSAVVTSTAVAVVLDGATVAFFLAVVDEASSAFYHTLLIQHEQGGVQIELLTIGYALHPTQADCDSGQSRSHLGQIYVFAFSQRYNVSHKIHSSIDKIKRP